MLIFLRISNVYPIIWLIHFWLSDDQLGVFKIECFSSSRIWSLRLLWQPPWKLRKAWSEVSKLLRFSSCHIVFIPLFLFFIYLLIYFWLRWVFVSVWGLSLVAASGGHSSSRCAGLSLSRPLLLRSTGCRRAGSVVVAHGPSCSVACGILPDQDSNPCPLHWQADSQPLRHQGSPATSFFSSCLDWKINIKS